jgi:hypothetical protein
MFEFQQDENIKKKTQENKREVAKPEKCVMKGEHFM